jgi:site-specific recombinase XerD
MMKNDVLDIAKYYAGWIDDSILGKSLNTTRAYEFSMKLFMEFLETTKGIGASSFSSSSDFSQNNIREWLVWLKNVRKCTPESCNARFSSLKAFLKYLGSRDVKYRHLYLDSQNVNRLKEKKRKVEGLTEAAVKALLEEPDAKTTTGYRDTVFMAFVYGTAARLDEVLSVKLSDLKLNSEHACVIVCGKGNKIRTLYLPPKLVSNLKKYIKKFHGTDADEDRYLFFSRVKGPKTKISQEAINKRLKIYALSAHVRCQDVPIDIHCHQFRHAKSTHLLNDGMNIAQLSKLLGHEQLSTTMVYLDITTDMQAKAMISMEDEKTRTLPQIWGKGKEKLSDLFKKGK